MAGVPLLGWGFAGLTRRLRETLNALDGRVNTVEGALTTLDERLDVIEVWSTRIKGVSATAPTPNENTQVGDIYLAATPQAGGYIGWVAVEVDGEIVFMGFGAIASS